MGLKLESAGLVASQVQLVDVLLHQAQMKCRKLPDTAIASDDIHLTYNCDYDVKDEGGDHAFRFIFVTVEFKCEAGELNPQLDVGDLEQDPIFYTGAQFVLIYRVMGDGEFSEQSLHNFSWLNGTYNAWPYWREFVQSTAARAGIPEVMIPVYRPVEAHVPDFPSLGTAGPSESVPKRRRQRRKEIAPQSD